MSSSATSRGVTISRERCVGGACVAILTLTNPPMNALHPDVLSSLFSRLQEAHTDPTVTAIVITGHGSNFSAGFDVSVFADNTRGGSGPLTRSSNLQGGVDAAAINSHFSRLIESGPKPVVAAIKGNCLGGGLECAMACSARVAVDGHPAKTSLGLPELKLGIIPGFGGTQRLPRLVGVQRAIEMMLQSTTLSARDAHACGLVDHLVPSSPDLLPRATALAAQLARGSVGSVGGGGGGGGGVVALLPPQPTLVRTDRLEAGGDVKALGALIAAARAKVRKTAPNVAYPQLCLDAIEAGLVHGGERGLVVERDAFNQAQADPAHAALVHLFFATRATKRIQGLTSGGGGGGGGGGGATATAGTAGGGGGAIQSVGLIGGGLMGSGIATASILAGIPVVLKEVNQEAVEAGLKRIEANLTSRVKKGALTEAKMTQMLANVKGTTKYDDLGDIDLVIEAALEDIPLKQQIFADLERCCKPSCILATNTSTISIDLVGAKCSPGTRSRILGAHFFSPAHVMPLLEIVRTQRTGKGPLLATLAYGTKIRKTSVVVGNCTGFAVNRMFFPYTMAACLLVDLGIDLYRIDATIMKFGMPMGPFRLSDLVGADIGLHVGANFTRDFPDRVYRSELIPSLAQRKLLGEKTKAGFYDFHHTRAGIPNLAVHPLVERSRKAAAEELGLTTLDYHSRAAEPPTLSDQDIIEMIFFPVVNEACRIMAEGIVDKASDLDVCAVMAMGFPSYRGGIVHWADSLRPPSKDRGREDWGTKGTKETHAPGYIARRLETWARMFPAVAGFFQPSTYLMQCADQGIKLSDGMNKGNRARL